MAVYFDHRTQAPNSGHNTDIQWHKNFAVLAVASYSETTGGSVNLYLEEVWEKLCGKHAYLTNISW